MKKSQKSILILIFAVLGSLVIAGLAYFWGRTSVKPETVVKEVVKTEKTNEEVAKTETATKPKPQIRKINSEPELAKSLNKFVTEKFRATPIDDFEIIADPNLKKPELILQQGTEPCIYKIPYGWGAGITEVIAYNFYKCRKAQNPNLHFEELIDVDTLYGESYE